jgi:hypothetical protein
LTAEEVLVEWENQIFSPRLNFLTDASVRIRQG